MFSGKNLPWSSAKPHTGTTEGYHQNSGALNGPTVIGALEQQPAIAPNAPITLTRVESESKAVSELAPEQDHVAEPKNPAKLKQMETARRVRVRRILGIVRDNVTVEVQHSNEFNEPLETQFIRAQFEILEQCRNDPGTNALLSVEYLMVLRAESLAPERHGTDKVPYIRIIHRDFNNDETLAKFHLMLWNRCRRACRPPFQLCYRVQTDFTAVGDAVSLLKWPSKHTLCGALGTAGDGPKQSSFTIGGLLELDRSFWALTAVHSEAAPKGQASPPESIENLIQRMINDDVLHKDLEEDLEPPARTACPARCFSHSSSEEISGATGTGASAKTAPLGDIEKIGSEWGLIRVKDPLMRLPNYVEIDSQRYYLSEVAQATKRASGTSVYVIAGASGTVSGNLSRNLTPLRLASREIAHVWAVSFRHGSGNHLRRGDSGSWVVEPRLGEIYGHIVSGTDDVAFVLPLQSVMKEIEDRYGKCCLPSPFYCLTELARAYGQLAAAYAIEVIRRDIPNRSKLIALAKIILRGGASPFEQGLSATVVKLGTDTVAAASKIAVDGAGTAVKIVGDIASTGIQIVGDTLGTFAMASSRIACTADKIAHDAADTARQTIHNEDLGSILGKVLRDSFGTRAKIVNDTTDTLAKIVGNVISAGAKVFSDSFSTMVKIGNDAMSTADKIVLHTETTVLKIRDDVLTTGTQAASQALRSRAAEAFLKLATDIFSGAGDVTIVDTILQLIRRSLEALTPSLCGAALIWKGIFSNGTDETSLHFILNHLYDLLQFLSDLVEPENVIPRFPAANVEIESGKDGFPGRDNPYNELDLRREENRHAVIYQVQRVAFTIIVILKMGREYVPSSGLGDLQMNVSLRSDFDEDGNPPHQPTFPGSWGTRYPLQRSCDKIRDTFLREVKGIYNRSDGILWDLIECCGERSAAAGELNTLIERTQSSKAAQETLERELSDALWPAEGSVPNKVIMIAHSQGVLILRLALHRLVRDNPKGSQRRMDMKEKLRVFTFGSPSLDWRVMDETEQSLSEYANATEHFAHKVDFVAMLGVVTHQDDQDSGYDCDPVFYSREGRAHLFGAHYPLGAEAYENGATSKLLRAVNGNVIA